MSLSLAQRLAVTEFLKKHFEGVRKDELNPEAQAEMVVGERHAAKFAGRVAGWVSVPTPATRVSSRTLLVAWCRKHLPGEVEEVTEYRVRPETERALIELVKKHGGWPQDGDMERIIPVDGIETGDPSPRVELGDDARDVIGAALRSGLADFAAMLAIGPAPEGGEPGE